MSLFPQRVSSDNLFPEIMFPSLRAARGFDNHLVKRPSPRLLGKLRVMFRSCLPEGRCMARAGGQMSDEPVLVTTWARQRQGRAMNGRMTRTPVGREHLLSLLAGCVSLRGPPLMVLAFALYRKQK